MTSETNDARLKRMRMRSWRRGTKEMDLILGPFADAHLANLTEAELLDYDELLNENDQDIYPWLSGQQVAPVPHRAIVERIVASLCHGS